MYCLGTIFQAGGIARTVALKEEPGMFQKAADVAAQRKWHKERLVPSSFLRLIPPFSFHPACSCAQGGIFFHKIPFPLLQEAGL